MSNSLARDARIAAARLRIGDMGMESSADLADLLHDLSFEIDRLSVDDGIIDLRGCVVRGTFEIVPGVKGVRNGVFTGPVRFRSTPLPPVNPLMQATLDDSPAVSLTNPTVCESSDAAPQAAGVTRVEAVSMRDRLALTLMEHHRGERIGSRTIRDVSINHTNEWYLARKEADVILAVQREGLVPVADAPAAPEEEHPMTAEREVPPNYAAMAAERDDEDRAFVLAMRRRTRRGSDERDHD